MGILKKIGRQQKRTEKYRQEKLARIRKMEDDIVYNIGGLKMPGKAWKEFVKPKSTLVAHEPPGRTGVLPERSEAEAEVAGGDHIPAQEGQVGPADTDQPELT